MENSFKYRLVAITLVGVFAVFNIGLPVVLHYCEMMKGTTTSTCGMCNTDNTDNFRIKFEKSETSCCKTVIAADRNKTEFLQTQNDALTQLLNYSTTSVLYATNIFDSITFTNLILNDTHSPPLIEDIPIFTSSLLI